MRTVTRYIANDGSQWDTEAEALARDVLYERVRQIMASLHRRPKNDGRRFENGHGYVQQSPETVRNTKEGLLWAAYEQTHSERFRWTNIDAVHPMEVVGRMLNDNPLLEPIDLAWRRLCCIDEHYREWGQPYFAMHPEAAELTKVG